MTLTAICGSSSQMPTCAVPSSSVLIRRRSLTVVARVPGIMTTALGSALCWIWRASAVPRVSITSPTIELQHWKVEKKVWATNGILVRHSDLGRGPLIVHNFMERYVLKYEFGN